MGQEKPPDPAQRLHPRAPVLALLPRLSDSPLGERVTHGHQQALNSCPHPPHRHPQPTLRKETGGRHLAVAPLPPSTQRHPTKMPTIRDAESLVLFSASRSSGFGAKLQENEWKGCFRRRASCGCGRGLFPGGPAGSPPHPVSTGRFAGAKRTLFANTCCEPAT